MERWVGAEYASPVGRLTLASDGEGLVGLWLEGQRYFGAGGRWALGEDAVLRAGLHWLEAYFRGDECPTPPLAPRGSAFQKAVWEVLLDIPRGSVTTYGAIAERLSRRWGRKVSPRAVGGAVGRNPISILVPCHRVVGADGRLTGYAGGVERKAWLLRHEGAAVERLKMG